MVERLIRTLLHGKLADIRELSFTFEEDKFIAAHKYEQYLGNEKRYVIYDELAQLD